MDTYYINKDHYLVGPNVTVAPIMPEALTQANIVPRTVILHTNAGSPLTRWDRLRAFMARQDITIECHFQVDMDGHVAQFMPTNRRADCNYKANGFAVSIETQDNGSATLSTTPWTVAQAEAIANVVAAVGHKYGIPYTSPTSYLDDGVGYHSQYAEWSVYRGKTCPGAARIRQMDWIRQRAAQLCACAPAGL